VGRVVEVENRGIQSVAQTTYATRFGQRVCLGRGSPHGMPTTEADTINADLLSFLKGTSTTAAA
jgi:hypothetical protein